MELFGRASWLMFLAGAIPTGVAGWWIGSRAGAAEPLALGLAALVSAGFSAFAAFLAWRWFAAPLRELERGLERWTRGDLSAPLDEGRMAGWRRLSREFSRAQADLQRSLDEAKADLARERARLQTLVEKLPDALVITNMRGEVLTFNAAAMPILGVGPKDVRAGDRALLSPLDPERWRMRVQEILTRHSAGEPVEVRGQLGAVSSFRTLVTMFNGAGDGDFGVLVMLRDVTAERRLEALKEEFFQAAAHDLRAPLFAIQGYLRLLRKSLVPTERQAAWLDSIDASCEKLTLFVKDALDAARIQNGRLRLSTSAVDPRALLARSVRLFAPLADERSISLESAAAPDAPAVFEADERLVERLLHNLVGNALKFTPRGGHVRVTAAARGAQIEFAVEDDGPGIPESQRAAIFEKFRQLDAPGPRSGFGLGLAICAKIVKLHRGVLWVEPGPIGGSRFVARLPLTQRADPKEAV
ncbi:MAG: PAS domain-containing sensor histidine kinase [Elusimicrobia bacterium]|nr:PAS domain-containing sensor histidine kinase [Elusimicrobiota bacterium]